jgi:hypothetical protein
MAFLTRYVRIRSGTGVDGGERCGRGTRRFEEGCAEVRERPLWGREIGKESLDLLG